MYQIVQRFSFICFFAATSLLGQDQAGLNLDAYLAMVRQANPSYQAAIKDWLAAQEAIQAEGYLPDPAVSLGIFVSEVETRVGPQKQRVGLEQKIPWKGKLKLDRDLAARKADGLQSQAEALRLELVREFTRLYADHYYMGRAIAITADHMELLTNLEEVVTQKYSTNTAHYNDLIRTQVAIDKLSDQLAGLQKAVQPNIAAMNALLGRPTQTVLPFPEKLPELDKQSKPLQADTTVEKHPLIQELTNKVETDRIAHAIAAKSRFPDFTLGLEWINTGESIFPQSPGSGDDPLILKFGMNLPINRKKYRARALAAAQRIDAAEMRKENMRLQLDARLARARFDYEDAERKIKLFRGQILPKARESVDVTLNSFETGTIKYDEVIDAEQTLLEIELAISRSETDRLKAAADLQALVPTTAGEEPILN